MSMLLSRPGKPSAGYVISPPPEDLPNGQSGIRRYRGLNQMKEFEVTRRIITLAYGRSVLYAELSEVRALHYTKN